MSQQRYTKDEIENAQELVARIQGVSSCRISTGENGEISEVHVVATADKSPKFVARDVESCLKAEARMDVDHRKIGVVIFDVPPRPEPASRPDAASDITPAPTIDLQSRSAPVMTTRSNDAAVLEFPVEEYAARFTFRSVNLFMSSDNIRAEVELGRDTDIAFGSARGHKPHQASFEVIAEATLQAVTECLDGNKRVCLGGVRRVNVDDTDVIVVTAELISGRDCKKLAGASVVDGNENQTVVFATLDAVNRILGKLNFSSTIEYKIK